MKGVRWLNLITELKRTAREWRRQEDLAALELKRRQAESELSLEMERRRRLLQLEHELEVLKRKQQFELSLLEQKQAQDRRDYQRYLQAVDQLQEQLRHAFRHAPEVIVLTIHHHAKQLLDRMWEAEDLHQRLQREQEFVKFLTTVYEDTLQAQGDGQPLLPQRALRLMLHNPS